jgi:hypothetical protein
VFEPFVNPSDATPAERNTGLAVEVSDDGETWQAVKIEDQDCRGCNKNIALIVDGKP